MAVRKHPLSNGCEAGTEDWRVLDRHCNHSAFNGGHWTASNYSAVKCMKCRRVWRTKADYVALLPDATQAERFK